MPDPTSRIRFSSVFPQEGMAHIAQTLSGSDIDGMVRVWPNSPGLEASRCAGIFGPGFWKDATGPLPVSQFKTQVRSSTDVLDNIVRNQPGSDLFWLIVPGFGQTDPVRKQANMQESSGPLLANVFQPIQTGSDPTCLLGKAF